MSKVSAGTDASKLKEVWALPVSDHLREQALTSIAKAPFKLWQKSLPAGAKDEPSLIRPLLNDLLAAESFVELNGPDSDFDSVLAVELTEERAHLWETNIWKLLASWSLPKPSSVLAGWEISGPGPRIKLQRIGKWLLLGWSTEKVSRINSLAEAATKTGRPVGTTTNGALFSFSADLPAVKQWVPVLRHFNLPQADVTVLPRGENLRTEARLTLSEPIKWKFEPWNFPTNRIRDPLTSFTVAQGVEPLLKSVPGFESLGLKQIPSQMCSWSHENLPFSTYWAFPMPDASNTVRRISPKARDFAKNYVADPVGQFIYTTNRSEIAWVGLPLAIPTLASLSEPSGDFLLAGLLPLLRKTNSPPAELFAQLNREKNLVLYDWELTSDRLSRAGLLFQVLDIVNRRTILNTNMPTIQWSDQIAPRLGNTITEITAASPTQLKLVRKSHLGLTGFELATLLRWIDSPAFPLSYQPPPPLPRKSKQPQVPSFP